MSFTQNTLNFHIYAPALVGYDIRPVAVAHAMEHALPGLRLGWTVTDKHQLRPLPERDAWLAQASRDGGFPLVCNGDENYPVMVSATEESARFGPGGQALLDVFAELPLETAALSAAASMLEGMGEGARAFWGHATPFEASVEIARQTRHPVRKPGVPPRGLPALKLPEQIRAPEIPQCLGWLNYWSAPAAKAIGFPDPARDAELLTRARRTPSGGWVMQLTEAPLDLDIPAHLDALKQAYERFPEIGGRSAQHPY